MYDKPTAYTQAVCSMLLLPFMSDAPDAEAALGRSSVTTAMAGPSTVTLKKSLLVLIGISSLSVLGQSTSRNRQASSRRSALAYFAQPPIEMDAPSKD
jgi:hypothetical protein